MLPHRGQETPFGQRRSSSSSRQESSHGNRSINVMRLSEVVSVMAQTPKRKKPRTLPADIAERPDAEIVERLFGKDVKRELDRMAGKDDSESTDNVIKG